MCDYLFCSKRKVANRVQNIVHVRLLTPEHCQFGAPRFSNPGCRWRMSGRGLVSYTGDSEISDEEEVESSGHVHAVVVPPAVRVHVGLQGLGIPTSGSTQPSTTPRTFLPPVVQSAPSMGLVAYTHDDEDAMNDSRDDSVFTIPSIRETVDSSLHSLRSTSPGDELEASSSNTLSVEVTDEPKSETEMDVGSPGKPLFLPLNSAQLPPEPPGRCAKALQDKVIALLQKEQKLGLDLNQHLQARKDFRNPSIYEKLVTVCNLDEFGTNFPEHLYDPKLWGEESHYNHLLEVQKKAYEKKEKAKLQDRTKIEFVKGTKRPAGTAPSTVGSTAGGEPMKKARKSKWDVSTVDSGGSKGNTPNKPGPGLGEIGAQARAQATHLNKELSKLAK